MFGAIDQQWQPVYAANGLVAPDNNQTQSGQSQQEMAYGDLGYASDGGFLNSIGYTGQNPYVQSTGLGQSMGNESGQLESGVNPGYTPEFLQFLKDKGLTLKTAPVGQSQVALQAFDANGQQVGTPLIKNVDPDNGFGYATMAASLFAGGAAAGLYGGAAEGGASSLGAFEGIPAGEGVGGATTSASSFTAPTAVGGVSYTAPEAAAYGGEAGMDLGAFEGIGSGAGGSGAAASGAYTPAASSSWLGDAASWAKANPGLVNTAGSLANGLIGAYTGNQAYNRQKDATNAANALWEPYRQFGITNGLNPASKLLQNPSSISQDPGYQFTTQQGMQALDRSAASKGGLYSGAQMKGAERFGQQNANTYFDKILGRYTGAAQLGATGTTNISNNLTNLGQAGAGAAMYQGNVAQNAINNGLGTYNWSQYSNDLRKYPG